MIDLNNSWCKPTEENYNALVALGFKELEYFKSYEAIKINWGYIALTDMKIDGVTDFWIDSNPKYKQVHLIDGEFEFVADEQKQECQFAKYGFEVPEFQCEILSKYGSWLMGYVVINQGQAPTPCMWFEHDGACSIHAEYNLTPVKKPWYDTVDWKSGVPIIDTDTNKFHGIGYHRYKNSIETQRGVTIIQDITCDEWRLATKEEVLSLFKEEK